METIPKLYKVQIEALGFQTQQHIAENGTREFRFFRNETSEYHRIGCVKTLSVADVEDPNRFRQHFRRIIRSLKAKMEREKKTAIE